MIDDELLQELLSKASGHYNSGDYRAAIDAWKEALSVDPSSQKAQEGIQMATLLLADWEPTAAIAEAPPGPTAPRSEPPEPADGSPEIPPDLTPAQVAARLDGGAARVRTLLRQRRYSEAVEGARSLVPIDPDSEEVQRLLEEAQQAFEAAPFIEEHLTLARELATQDRMDEAEAQCKKVFALDPTNPDGHVLLMEIRARRAKEARSPVPVPQADVGGMTMRIDAAKLNGIQRPPAEEGQAAVPAAEALPDDLFDFEPSSPADTEARPREDALPLSAVGPEDDATTHDPGHHDMNPAVVDEAAAEPPEAHSSATEEYVDAATVVPPTVRLVKRTGDEKETVDSLMTKLEELESLQGPADPPAPPAPSPTPPARDAGGWERELEDLNQKTGQHDIVGRSAAKSASRKAEPEGDVDLSSLFGDDLGAPAEATAAPAAAEPPPQGDEPAHPPAEAEDPSHEAPETAAGIDPGDEMTASPGRSVEASARRAPAPPADARGRTAVPLYFALLGVAILAVAGGVWWFFIQPRTASGQVPPASTAPPPSSRGGSSGAEGALPTPIGSTSRQAAQPPRPGPAEGAVVPPPSTVATPAAAPTSLPAAAGVATPDRTNATVPRATGADTAPAPPAPATRPRSPEEIKREAERHMTEGKRLLAQEKWQEAHAEFAAVLALDPMSFESRELLDKTQARIDQDLKVRKDLDDARHAFDDKDYQGSLWKLYRLPHDAKLGNIDLHIRNAWFNWAIVGLKGGDAVDAKQKLTEVLQADPGDAEAAKLMEVAERYAARPKDRYFYSVVDTLRFRAFDQK